MGGDDLKSRSEAKPRKRPGKERGILARRWVRYLLYSFGVFTLVFGGAFAWLYVSYSRLVEERLHGERERTLPRVYARPVELRRGQMLSETDLIARLNDLGYAQREQASQPGEFARARNAIALTPRSGTLAGKTVRIVFPGAPAVRQASNAPGVRRGVQAIEIDGKRTEMIRLDPPLLTALMTSGARQKRRHVPIATIPTRMQQAVLSAEDQSFYLHPGINPIRLIAAAIRNITNSDSAPVGYSTITQQLARMFFLADEFNAELRSGERGRSWGSRWRKVREIVMAVVLDRRASKDEILELYLNDVYLGQRGSFAIHGVAEASRIFFAKDVANVSLSEAAVIAGSILYPGAPFNNPKRAIERRNAVLQAMAGEEFISDDEATAASREPLQVVARAVDNEAPFFVDMVSAQIADQFPGVTAQPDPVSVFTSLDINMQRAALDAVRTGLARVDEQLATRRRRTNERPQASLVAVDPRTGEILAMVGGRSYSTSQYNRALVARRQPGSTFKPFVYLAAFEYAAEQGRTDLTPASLTLDEPATFTFDDQVWEPANYDEYDGEITWRRALAMSRNLATIHVGQEIGYEQIASLWRRVGVGTPPRAFPSITLGVFELTPLEVAEAYTLFMNGGYVRPLKAIDHVQAGTRELRPAAPRLREVARPDSTFLVTNMMRSVLTEGTGASARASGFVLDAAGKSGTTNDLRDAWFVGFTPELLTVVWVGYDSNQPIGLSGSQAALPIWTEFMKSALGGRDSLAFQPPDGVSFAEIDRDTGKLATPACPRVMTESFAAGTEPYEICPLHQF